ncbi:MAG: PepSY-associated TM helix domain-containing protein [Verrucomicrobiota bacterium]
MNFRRILFWLHLLAGVSAGAVIGVMCLTGGALAFEKEIMAWSERDLRRIQVPADGAHPLALDELLAKARADSPNLRPSMVTIYADPRCAVLLSAGRTNAVYVDPYHGKVKRSARSPWRSFMQTMVNWHRWLGQDGDRRAVTKAITGACNAAFLFLALTGLYLWWPRHWSGPLLRAIALFDLRLRGKARDWNWHNVIGLWSAPVLIVLTATAMPISYRWAGDLIYTLTGTAAPPPSAAPPGSAADVAVPSPPPGVPRISPGKALAAAQQAVPSWQEITLRLGVDRAQGSGRALRPGPGDDSSGRPRPLMVTVKPRAAWPKFASVQLAVDPFTGAVLRREEYAGYNRGRKVRSWTRFLHTGEALGVAGQALAGFASLGGAMLVYTGCALAWRRFFSKRQEVSPSPALADSLSRRMGEDRARVLGTTCGRAFRWITGRQAGPSGP